MNRPGPKNRTSSRRAKTSEGGIGWHLPKADGSLTARPFTRTPPAALFTIELLAEDGATWADLAETINFDPDALMVARTFVEAGHGDVPARSHLATGSWP